MVVALYKQKKLVDRSVPQCCPNVSDFGRLVTKYQAAQRHQYAAEVCEEHTCALMVTMAHLMINVKPGLKAGLLLTNLTRQSSAYTYSYTGNQLQSVTGLTSGTYTYDDNGNMHYDARNDKTVNYNLLNLPRNITASGFNLNYAYDANGQKLRKDNGTTVTDYISGIQYDNGAISFIQTDEGRAINSGGSYTYEYTLTDHLGNSRVS